MSFKYKTTIGLKLLLLLLKMRWTHCLDRQSYIRENIEFQNDAIKNVENNYFQKITSIIKENPSLSIYDKHVNSGGVIGINYYYNTILILFDGGEALYILKTYCLGCNDVLNTHSFTPFEQSLSRVEEPFIQAMEIHCKHCGIASSKHFKWNNTDISNVKIRQTINFKLPLEQIFKRNFEKKSPKYQEICNMDIYDIIKNLSKNEKHNSMWIDDLSLVLFNVIAVNMEKKILLRLNVNGSRQISYDYYFLKCGHCLLGKKLFITDDKNVNNKNMIINSLENIECNQCCPSPFLLTILGCIITYAIFCQMF